MINITHYEFVVGSIFYFIYYNIFSRGALAYLTFWGCDVMSKKMVNYLILFFLVIIAIGYFIMSNSLTSTNTSEAIGPGYFPKILSILLIVLCIFDFIKVWRENKKETQKVELNYKFIVITLGLTVLFLLTWQMIGYFYVLVFLFFSMIFSIYKPKLKSLPVYILVSFMLVLLIYLLFNNLLKIHF